jgi:hypothetical protein
MKRKRLTRISMVKIGVKKSAAEKAATERRKAASAARETNRPLFDQLMKIKKKARLIVRPPYTRGEYVMEIYGLAYRWSKEGTLPAMLKMIAVGENKKLRPGANDLTALVRATSDFDKGLVSNYAKRIAAGLSRKTARTPLHFRQTLPGEWW